MKKLLLLLLLTSCSGQRYLSRDYLVSEQKRIVTYYDNRYKGFPYSRRFYEITDSNATSISGDDRTTMALIYTEIKAKRPYDSTDRFGSDFFALERDILNGQFNSAIAGR